MHAQIAFVSYWPLHGHEIVAMQVSVLTRIDCVIQIVIQIDPFTIPTLYTEMTARTLLLDM